MRAYRLEVRLGVPHSCAAGASSSRSSGGGHSSPGYRARRSTRWTDGWLSPQARAISLEAADLVAQPQDSLALCIAILVLGIA